MPRPTDAVTLVTSTGTYTVFDAVTTGLLCVESLRRTNVASMSLPYNINIYAVGGSKLLLMERTPALIKLFSKATPVYAGGVLQFTLRATGATLSLAKALASVGVLVSGLVYDNASLTLAGVPMQLFDINYKAGAGLGEGSGANDVVPLVYTYAPAISDPRVFSFARLPYYNFSGTNSFMYSALSPAVSWGTRWKVECFVKWGGTMLPLDPNGYSAILDTRAQTGWNFTNALVLMINNTGQLGVWSPAQVVGWSSGTFVYTGGIVKSNDWSHCVWQCSPATGIQVLVDGVLTYTSNYTPTVTNYNYLCFGGVVDLQINTFLHLQGSLQQLLFRAGSTVDMYTNGYTIPYDMSAVASGSADVIYRMPAHFTGLTVPSGCTVTETTP